MTADLVCLEAWLTELQVEHVALDSTGGYGYPISNLLEEGRTVLLVNPQHLKAVPGRKTDVRASEWLADLLRHGLLAPSCIPPQPIRELRSLTRYRNQLVNERIQEANRLQQVLESANSKLAVVASALLGVSGRAMLEALMGGEQDGAQMAEHARGRMRQRLPELRQALEGGGTGQLASSLPLAPDAHAQRWGRPASGGDRAADRALSAAVCGRQPPPADDCGDRRPSRRGPDQRNWRRHEST
jgi:transposase